MSTVYEALKKAAREQAQSAAGSHAAADYSSSRPLTADGQAHADVAEDAPIPLAEQQEDWASDLLIGERVNGRAADEFQVLSTQVRRLAADRNLRVFAIASALAGEGKSFVTLNLAISLARTGRSVTLVDADLRTPALHKAFGLTPLHGLLGYLCEQTDYGDCVYKTPLAGLSLVPAGGSTAAGPELFASARMQQFIAAARTASTEYVLIDCPPLLAASETQILCRLVDSMLFVVSANQTARSAVSRALALIKGVEILGMVLNRFEPLYSHRAVYDYRKYRGPQNGQGA